MMPAFSAAISLDGVAEVPLVVQADRRDDRDRAASMTLVASQVPPMPTSTTATSTGASAKAAYAMRGQHLEERQRGSVGWRSSTSSR